MAAGALNFTPVNDPQPPTPTPVGGELTRIPEPGSTEPTPAGRTPFHPAASGLLLVVDNLWNLPDFSVIGWFVTVPMSFASVFGPVFWIQRRFHGDSRRVAALKALFLGVVAAVPFSVTGTPVGLALLAWAGIKHPWGGAKK